jgi:hypothetical protein
MLACPLPKWLGARALLIVIALAAGVVAVALLAVFGLPYGGSHREAFAHFYEFPGNGNTTHLHIDADITNGTRPCDPIDATATVTVGSVHKVGVCLETYVPNSVQSFELHIRYTGDPDATPPTTLNTAATVPYVGKKCGTDPACLDANPDGNDSGVCPGEGGGALAFCLDRLDNDGDTLVDMADPDCNCVDDPARLGVFWDCTGLGIAPPVGEDPRTNVADAFIVCNAVIVGWPYLTDMDLTANPGLLATIEFTAQRAGTDTIDFGPIDATNLNNAMYPRPGGGAARCMTQVPADQVGCFGATIHKVAAPPAIPSEVLSPILGDLETVSSLEECHDTKWCFNQHGSCDGGIGHCVGGGVCQADDTYAWDANLNTPTPDSDAGMPVHAVAEGFVAETYAECTNGDDGSSGQLLIRHDLGGIIWWSGYLHMSNILVTPGTHVYANSLLGYISDKGATNKHLHFVVYTGENTRGSLVSFDARIVPRLGSTSLIAAAAAGDTELQVGSLEGFAPGDLVRINPGGPNAEDSWIASIGSLVLASPLRFAHEAGEPIVKIPAAPVGGIAELPDVDTAPAEQAGAPSAGSGWSAGDYAALTGGLSAAVLAVAAGAWYARRRWLQ